MRGARPPYTPGFRTAQGALGDLFFFLLITLKPRVECYRSLCASNTNCTEERWSHTEEVDVGSGATLVEIGGG